ncbi:Pyridoxamine 5'-phosphate oxidase-related, FMN-binding [Olavius algarvensis associated proteobacterium Delta 3]|nr:Pyridoxamine 5'-phosphate oxidase-related, FMN-binding [Olavius algarvensis associated proteobacterium Delta 3]
MRRKDKEITDPAVIESIIRQSIVCRLAMCDGDTLYIVPLSFGYQNRALYFHSATEGKKMDILRRNPKVCFEVDLGPAVKKAEQPCRWGMTFRSVIGTGTVHFLESPAEKRRALEILMGHYANARFEIPDSKLDSITVFRVDVKEMTGKQSD